MFYSIINVLFTSTYESMHKHIIQSSVTCQITHNSTHIYTYCHIHPLVEVHAPASCGRGSEGDGQTILQLTRRRR